LCDHNGKRVEAAKKMIGTPAPTFTDFDRMIKETRPDTVTVTTVDATHARYIIRAMELGCDVMSEKPLCTDEDQARAILDAQKKTGKKITVTFNARHGLKDKKVKELLMRKAVGDLISVDFHEYLDTSHGADYFRRWHRLRERSGSLWVHKSTHHFDLVNWWLDADPVEVSAFGGLNHYGRKGPFRHTHCRPCPHKAECAFHWDITKDPKLVALYVDAESADGYHRDGCVFREDVNIPDTMNAVVRYSNGTTMSYSVNTFMPIEGYRLAFNGTKGRLEVRDYERQPWDPGEESEIHVVRNFGQRVKIEVPAPEGGHGGGDDRLRDVIFRQTTVPDHMRLPGSRAGAMSCLTGIAARKSADEGRPVKIAELVRL
jgi:predicted dehydrogenase